jgi:hypothetical protein
MKAIKQAELNDILYSHYNEDEISASKVTELINEKADVFAINFTKWFQNLTDYHPEKNEEINYNELLKMFKTQNDSDSNG